MRRLALRCCLLLPTPAWALPDIALEQVAGPTATFTGAPATFQLVLYNAGDASGPFDTSIRASVDSVYQVSDPLICTATGTVLAAGQRRAVPASCTWPTDAVTPTGDWYVVARTAEGISDADASDNTNVYGPVGVVGTGTGGRPDLQPAALTPPAQALPGATVTVRYEALNDGSVDAPATTTQLWLSVDAVRDPSDTALCADALPALAAGASTSRTVSGCAVPGAWPPGTAYVLLQLDAAQGVTESDESDNERFASLDLVALPDEAPDLVVDRLDAAEAAVPGRKVPVEVTVANAGDALAPSSALEVVLSDDATFDARDVALCSGTIGPLGIGASETLRLRSCLVPEDASAARGWLVARLDPDGAVPESDESNNDAAREIVVTGDGGADTDLPGPDDTDPADTDAATDTDLPPPTYGTFGCACGARPGHAPWTYALLTLVPLLRRRRAEEAS